MFQASKSKAFHSGGSLIKKMDEFQLYTSSLIGVALLLYAWYWIRISLNSGGSLPPSPPALPIIGNLHQLGQLPHRSLWMLSRKHGPLMLLHLGQTPVVVVSSADFAKEIVRTHDVAFADKPAMKDLKRVFYDLKDLLNLPYGEQWRKLRGIVVTELLSSSRVKSFSSSVREEVTALFLQKIREHCSTATPLNLTKMLAALSNELISRAAFGDTEHGKKFLELIEEGVELLFNFTLGDFIPWLAWINRLNGRDASIDRIVRKRDEIMDALIQDHLKISSTSTAGSDKNIISILLGIYSGGIPGLSIDLLSVKGVILDVFAAGTDTTATILVWIMTELIRHPAVMMKLQDEIRGIARGKQHTMIISDEDLQKMHYLQCVIKETFRLHPPLAIFTRAARDHVNIKGYEIAPKTMVMINVWAIGRDPDCWDEPEKFMPERFLNSSLDLKGFDCQLIPFGAGRRSCPGLGFATVSIEHTVANLMLNFDWASPDGEQLDVTERPGFTNSKKTPLIVVATPAI